MARIQMYTTRWCGYCVRAKELLDGRGLEYEEIHLDDDPIFRQRLFDLTGGWTVPQIRSTNGQSAATPSFGGSTAKAASTRSRPSTTRGRRAGPCRVLSIRSAI